MFRRFLLFVLVAATHGAVGAAELPLARFDVPEPAATELAGLLQRVLETTLLTDGLDVADAEDEERQLRRLRDSALDVIATEGYFAASIRAEVDPDRRARYVLRTEPGTRARVGQVDIEIRGAIAAQPDRVAALRNGWELGPGRPFRSAAWSTAKIRLLERDYAAARLVESAAEVNAEAATVRLQVVIDSGPAFTFGALQITSKLERYDAALVERYNPIVPGDPYESAKLLELQRRLQSSPYFARVLVDVELDTSRPDRVPVRLEVTEAKSKRIAIGTGLSTDTGPRLEATYRQTQLFGFPYMIQTGAGIDRTRSVAYADLFLPPKPGGALDSLGALIERTDIQDVLTSRWATGVARAHSNESDGVGHDTRLSINFQRESRRLRGDPAAGSQINDVLSSTYTWTRRTVNSITDPRTGDILTLSGSVGVRRAGVSDLLQQTFVRGYGRYLRYFELSPRDQLILRGEIGHVVTDNVQFVPNEFLFRTGGTGTVRGYRYQSLGVQSGTATLGSRSLITGSAEYVRWFSEAWGAAAFYDVGDADNRLFNIRWARGYGVGPRWRTLAGPLALDFAYGERDRRWRVHFSIAIAF